MLDVEFTQLSDTGHTRDHNEDYLGYVLPYTPAQLRSHGCVFALADGVGGQQKGEVASELAVETLLAGFSAAKTGEAHKALLSRLVQAGIAGFRCLAPDRAPASFWRQIISRLKQEDPQCRFLAWTPGVERAALPRLERVGFDGVCSSLAWWDGRAHGCEARTWASK